MSFFVVENDRDDMMQNNNFAESDKEVEKNLPVFVLKHSSTLWEIIIKDNCIWNKVA